MKNKKKINHIITYSSSAAYPVHLQKNKKYRLLREMILIFQKILLENLIYPMVGLSLITNISLY